MKATQRHLVLFILALIILLSSIGTVLAASTTDKNMNSRTLAPQFQDITDSDPNAMYIRYLVNQSVMSGYPDGYFHTSEGLTRAQAAAVMVRVAGLSPSELGGKMFPDVEKDHWAAGCIARCVQAGYLKGYPDGSFKPEERLSRAQGISLVLRLSKQDMSKAELPALADVSPEYWAAPQIATGLAARMIGLSSDQQHYLPEQAISREEWSRTLAILLTSDPEQYKTPLNGIISVENGSVELSRGGKTTRLETETALQTKDIIESQEGGSAVINYPDGSSVLIKENTRIEIKDSQGRSYIRKDGSPGIAVDYLNIGIKSGKIFTALAIPGAKVEAKKASKENLLASLDNLPYIAAAEALPPWYQSAQQKKIKVKVDMPYGVASIRGTFIGISVAPGGQCSVSCLTGSVQVSSGAHSVNLNGGQSTGLQQQGTPPAPPVTMNVQQQQEFQQAREWVEQTALQIDQNQAPPLPPPPPPAAGSMGQEQTQQSGQFGEQEQQVQQTLQQLQLPSTLDTVQKALNGSDSSLGSNPNNMNIPGAPTGGDSGGVSHDDQSARIQSIAGISGSVIKGQSYIPPVTVTATLSSGATKQVPISWENNNPDTSFVGVLTINGSVAGYSGTVTLTLSIDPPITRIDDMSVSVAEGDPYELPHTVTAILSDGSTRQEAVNWDSSHFDTSQPGIVTVNGRVQGYSETVKLVIIVERKLGAPITIIPGQPLNLAGGITIDLGSLAVPEGATVTVNEITRPDTAAAGLEPAGKVIDVSFANIEITQAISLTIPVNPGVNPEQAAIYFYNGSAWEYQPSQAVNGSVSAMLSHFSIYGVLMDNTPPSQPSLSQGNASAQGVELNFTATDNSAVAEYQIYRNGELINTVETQNYLDTAIDASQSYSYQVKAIDKSGNQSVLSESLEIRVNSSGKEMLGFVLSEQTGAAIIDNVNHRINIEVKNGSDLKHLLPQISISEGASIEPASGTARDFSSSVVYTITAADGSSQEWTVVIKTEQTNKPTLSGISIFIVRETGNTPLELNPAFNPEQQFYSSTVPRDAKQISITAAPAEPENIIKVNGQETGAQLPVIIDLDANQTLIQVEVTAADARSQSYTIRINWKTADDNSNLSMLNISLGILKPVFNPDTLIYSASVGNEVSTISVNAVAENPNTKVSINNGLESRGSASATIPLNEGNNSVVVKVLAEDGATSKDYSVSIIRDYAPVQPPSQNIEINNVAAIPQAFAVGGTAQLLVDTVPAGAALSFSSSDNGIAAVNPATGLLTGVAPGITTITVTASKCGFNNSSKNINVTVYNPGIPGGETSIRITPSSYPASSINELIPVEVKLEAVTNLYALEIHISFDPQALALVNESGQEVFSVQAGDIFASLANYQVQNQVDQANGKIHLAISCLGQVDGQTGNCTVCRFYLKTKSESSSTLVIYKNIILEKQIQTNSIIQITPSIGNSQINF